MAQGDRPVGRDVSAGTIWVSAKENVLNVLVDAFEHTLNIGPKIIYHPYADECIDLLKQIRSIPDIPRTILQ